ncbi:hypothetical protein SERLADRAFT_469475 [Serpula lacrymans var. lacrymans S7.9]|uniref:Uncharacterized protein n=1 Tax=Serpula lacrymans var. lacrymans (strain S7.9) TaxID=578457 RepID=F8P0B8_SERL9|nr:uncharacterized protein SERLADRAFT_469475 [Serpula lacrymans var. lacrymans S7.9]EGO23491.1 hypothetical protein SERLADRAFT_469475 [Serpula lacrymans var. lacrymans S7.9]
MSLRYKPRWRLQEHSNVITCLAFSPHGTYIAAGGVDGKLSIWFYDLGRLLYVVSGHAGVLSLSWIGPSEQSLLCGLQDGTVLSVEIDQSLTATGYFAHQYPVECISISGDTVATGAHKEVHVWEFRERGANWRRVSKLDLPPSVGSNRSDEIIVTSLHWARTKYSPNALLVSYMHHGITFWDISSRMILHFISVKTLVASTSLSPRHQYLAVSSIHNGFDIYDLNSDAPIMSFNQPTSKGICIPVLFAHHGFAVLGGSTEGKARLWAIETGNLIHTLHHSDDDTIQAIAAHYDASGDRFMIATGSHSPNDKHYIQLWHAQDIYRDNIPARLMTLLSPPAQLQDHHNMSWTHWIAWFIFLFIGFILSWLFVYWKDKTSI